MSSVRDLVVQVGVLLGRSARDVQPFVRTLEENWYDSVQSLKDATADDLSALGLPRRFAVELCNAAAETRGGSKTYGSKGKGGDSYNDDRGKGKGKNKGKGKDRDEGKGHNKGKGKSRGDFQAKIPIDISPFKSDTDFLFRPKLLGNKGTNIFHIQDQCGVQIKLTGEDEDGYLEFVITAADEDSLEKATAMCEDLVAAVIDEFESYAGDGSRGSGKGKGKNKKGGEKGKSKGKEKGKSKSRGAHEIRIPIDTEGIDPEFHLRAKLVGEGGRNVKHIEAAAQAHLRVEYDDGEGMAFTISADDEAAVAAAREMCEDLLSTVLEEAGVSRKRSRPEGGKKGGKGKRKGDAGDERARKAPRTDA